MAYFTAEEVVALRAVTRNLGNLIVQKSIMSKEFLAIIMPKYELAKTTGNLNDAYEEAKQVIETLSAEENYPKSAIKRLNDINKTVSNLVEHNVWDSNYNLLTFGNIEAIAKMFSHVAKHIKDKKLMVKADGTKIDARDVNRHFIAKLKETSAECLELLNAHNMAEHTAKSIETPFEPLVDLVDNARFYDDKMADKISALSKEFKVDEDETKVTATIGTLLAKLDDATRRALLEKELAKLMPQPANTEVETAA